MPVVPRECEAAWARDEVTNVAAPWSCVLRTLTETHGKLPNARFSNLAGTHFPHLTHGVQLVETEYGSV
jgi:hypothetical protein